MKISYDKHTVVKDDSMSYVTYSASGSKPTSICNPTFIYLHHLMANTIFTCHKSQNKGLHSSYYLCLGFGASHKKTDSVVPWTAAKIFKMEGNVSLSTTVANFSSNSRTPLKLLTLIPPIGCMMMISIWIRMRMTLHPNEGVLVEVREVLDVRGVLHPRRCLNPL
ncbi:hypothetical protein Cgig2_023046 [Carnegiea gigantea]|uniref:Uncharacterized protein n=1 Tax=Carnegiea gigantea TaxID=171969 RepID=A0A9Q1GTD6_9CARY|nr:hypothetical protein Cgig2_023046 [Carnegiea gigantea]